MLCVLKYRLLLPLSKLSKIPDVTNPTIRTPKEIASIRIAVVMVSICNRLQTTNEVKTTVPNPINTWIINTNGFKGFPVWLNQMPLAMAKKYMTSEETICNTKLISIKFSKILKISPN